MSFVFPPLKLGEWKGTRDTLHKYCRLAGAIREALSDPLPDSIHTNLLLCKNGFTTSSIQKNEENPDKFFEVIIDLRHRKLNIESNYREPMQVALTGQSLNALCDEACSLLTDIGIAVPLDRPSFLEGARGEFDDKKLKIFWKAVTSTNGVLKKIENKLRGKTTPIQLLVDTFNVALTWRCGDVFTGYFIEQIDFGFTAGDDQYPDAYFYMASFPDTQALSKIMTALDFSDRNKSSKIILPYSNVSDSRDGELFLFDFFNCILK